MLPGFVLWQFDKVIMVTSGELETWQLSDISDGLPETRRFREIGLQPGRFVANMPLISLVPLCLILLCGVCEVLKRLVQDQRVKTVASKA